MEIDVTELTVHRDQQPILRNLTFHVNAGECVAVMGPSGCGKSTLLKIMAGLWPANEGHVVLGGAPALPNSPDPRMGYLPQNTELLLFRWKTALEHVRWPRALRGLSSGDLPEKLLAAVGLAEKLHSLPGQLSGGEQRRLAFAMILAQEPTLLLMDEPFSGLDLDLTYRLWDVLHNHCATSATIVFVTHSFDDAAALSDQTLVLQRRYGGSGLVPDIAPRRKFVTTSSSVTGPLELFRGGGCSEYRSYLTEVFFESLDTSLRPLQ